MFQVETDSEQLIIDLIYVLSVHRTLSNIFITAACFKENVPGLVQMTFFGTREISCSSSYGLFTAGLDAFECAISVASRVIVHKMALCTFTPCAELSRSGNLGIPQSAKIIDNAVSLSPGWGIDQWLEEHKSDSCGSIPYNTLTHPLSAPIKHTHSGIQRMHMRTHTLQSLSTNNIKVHGSAHKHKQITK